MIIEAPLGAGLGVVAHPDATVDGVDRLAVGQGVVCQQGAEGGHIDAAMREGGVEATPAAPVRRGQAQVDRRRDRPSGQQGVDEVEEGIAALREAGIHVIAEGAEVRSSSHHRSNGATGTGYAPVRPATPPPGLNHKLTALFIVV